MYVRQSIGIELGLFGHGEVLPQKYQSGGVPGGLVVTLHPHPRNPPPPPFLLFPLLRPVTPAAMRQGDANATPTTGRGRSIADVATQPEPGICFSKRPLDCRFQLPHLANLAGWHC